MKQITIFFLIIIVSSSYLYAQKKQINFDLTCTSKKEKWKGKGTKNNPYKIFFPKAHSASCKTLRFLYSGNGVLEYFQILNLVSQKKYLFLMKRKEGKKPMKLEIQGNLPGITASIISMKVGKSFSTGIIANIDGVFSYSAITSPSSLFTYYLSKHK